MLTWASQEKYSLLRGKQCLLSVTRLVLRYSKLVLVVVVGAWRYCTNPVNAVVCYSAPQDRLLGKSQVSSTKQSGCLRIAGMPQQAPLSVGVGLCLIRFDRSSQLR